MAPPTKSTAYDSVLEDLQKLKVPEQKRLLKALQALLYPDSTAAADFAAELREKRFHKGFICPRCDSEEVIRFGIYQERQRYRCKACRRTFNDTTGTPLAGTHLREKWLKYVEYMVRGLPLRKIAEKLEIAVSTAFVWRHKVLNALRKLERPSFKGVLEADETFFLHSKKGERNIQGREPRKRGGTAPKPGISKDQDCVLVARDRTGQTIACLACQGQISVRQAMTVLEGRLGEVTVICTDGHSTWKMVAEIEELQHVVLNASKKQRVRSLYHIQNVNGFHSRLNRWISRFNGVASKFLDNYLTWFNFLDAHRLEASEGKRNGLILSACMPVCPDTYQTIRSTTFTLPS